MNLVHFAHSPHSEKIQDRLLETLCRHFFRVEAEGLENLPCTGPVVVIANHSGYAGADAIVLAHLIHRDVGRPVRILAHRAFFAWSGWVRRLAESYGLRPASFDEGVRLMRAGDLLLVFPEAESGNFKPSSQRYRLRRFHSGFARMALASGATVVPAVVIGAEESHLNLGRIDLRRTVGFQLPVPFNLMPLPAKWKVRFLPPLPLSLIAEGALDDRRRLRDLCVLVRKSMARAIHQLLRERQYVYFPKEIGP